ncbi:MAG: NAD(P)H-dependent oxidoreductase [Proteobacteria bacterium]|nr:NAD(P)H-dependent oxidoreductase [Pseudomonadota bacterium]
MTSILHIDCSARTSESVTRVLSGRVVKSLRTADAGATVTRRDLTTMDLPHVDGTVAEALFIDDEALDDQHKRALALSDLLTSELLWADTVVAGIPMYNFGVPSTFKAWIDLVVRPRKTFRKIAKGQLEGLCQGKRLFACTAGHGQFNGTPIDHLRPYLEKVFGFIGFDEVVFFDAERMAWGPEEKQQSIAAASAAIDAHFAL